MIYDLLQDIETLFMINVCAYCHPQELSVLPHTWRLVSPIDRCATSTLLVQATDPEAAIHSLEMVPVTPGLGADPEICRERQVGRNKTITTFLHNFHLELPTPACFCNSPVNSRWVICTFTTQLPQHISPNMDTSGMPIKVSHYSGLLLVH